ncbi:hypothetical protein ILYODFUR_029042 [Ilyodon furcidens]|uniref:Uncharacterized protein n=1 Tax=Ilyodon furcidens TaxID=33524 RepID=A0ABV0TBY5_9TELE
MEAAESLPIKREQPVCLSTFALLTITCGPKTHLKLHLLDGWGVKLQKYNLWIIWLRQRKKSWVNMKRKTSERTVFVYLIMQSADIDKQYSKNHSKNIHSYLKNIMLLHSHVWSGCLLPAQSIYCSCEKDCVLS